MKKLLCFMLAVMLVACAGENSKESEKVYICTGYMSECYHEDPDCRGLIRCSRDIEDITIEEAEEMGRTPCQICCE